MQLVLEKLLGGADSQSRSRENYPTRMTATLLNYGCMVSASRNMRYEYTPRDVFCTRNVLRVASRQTRKQSYHFPGLVSVVRSKCINVIHNAFRYFDYPGYDGTRRRGKLHLRLSEDATSNDVGATVERETFSF